MKTVQLAIHDSEYTQALRNLLLRDGAHRVYVVDKPDLKLEGVVVIDENRFDALSLADTEPERFVIVTRKGTDHLAKVWDAGVRHVVFEEDSPNTAQLAIIAAELRWPRVSAKPAGGPSVGVDKRHTNNFTIVDERSRLARCGHKNASPHQL